MRLIPRPAPILSSDVLTLEQNLDPKPTPLILSITAPPLCHPFTFACLFPGSLAFSLSQLG